MSTLLLWLLLLDITVHAAVTGVLSRSSIGDANYFKALGVA
jgi:hypothetical protein